MISGVTASRPLIGRAEALSTLARRLELARQGQGALVLISGEAGIGKTALAVAFQEDARAEGVVVASGRCYERGAMPGFAPWHGLLAELRDADVLNASDLPAPFGDGPPALSGYQLMQALAERLRSAAAHPLVLLLEDAHWADPDSLELLEVATRQLDQVPLLVMVTFRPEDVQRDHVLYDLLPHLQRDRPVTTLKLTELTPAEVGTLVDSRLGPPSQELAVYLHERSDGNPLFLLQLLRELTERHLLVPDAEGRLLPPASTVQVPDLLQQIVRQRVVRLGPDAGALLEVASVVGQEWALDVAEAVLGWDEGRLLLALEAVLAARLVTPGPERRETYRFTHGLFREVLYGELIGRRRRHLHGQVAAALEAVARVAREETANPALLAHHYARAECWEQAVDHALAAGDAARDRYASHSALQFYLLALEAAEALPPAARAEICRDLYQRLGQARLILNQREAAETDYVRAVDSARAAGDDPAESRALTWLSLIRTRLYRLEEASATAVSALSVARRAGAPRLLALAHWGLGHVHQIRGELDRSWSHLEEGERLAREIRDPQLLALILQDQALQSVWSGRYPRAERLAEEALAAARDSRDAFGIAGAFQRLGMVYGEQGRYGEALRALAEGLRHAEELGDRRSQIKLLNTTGWIHGELGDAVTARGWDQRALEVARGGADDRTAEAERYSLLNLAADELQAGRDGEAESYLREIEGLLDRHEYGRFRYLNRFQLQRAEIALVQGDLDEAERWSAEAAAVARAQGLPKNLAKALVSSGRARLARQRPREAAALLAEAVALVDTLQHGSLRWRARLWLGRALAPHRPGAAAESFQQASDQVDQIAGSLADERLRACFLESPEVRAVRAALAERAAVSRPEGRPAGLTEREIEVLRLIAQGLTNLHIADALCISVKTANAHVANILGKTGSSNRAAAAAFASRQGLV